MKHFCVAFMNAQSTSFVKPSVRHLFATPLIIAEMPAEIGSEINQRLKDFLLAKEQEVGSQRASNQGGWQSDTKLIEWGGPDVQTILTSIKQMLDQITVHYNQDGVHRDSIDWKVNGWANINRNGDSNASHIHPGAYWSAVYYIATDAEDPTATGGDFQMMDPRGGLSLMYCPLLRIGLEGYLTAGNKETHKPHPGQCLIFPSWLSHSVTPYIGKGVRISLAFNFSV